MFPLVGSIKVSPNLIRCDSSASSTMRRPIRSLTEPPALKNSHFATAIRKEEERERDGRGKVEKGGGDRNNKCTKITLQTFSLSNAIDSHHRSVPNSLEDVLHDSVVRERRANGVRILRTLFIRHVQFPRAFRGLRAGVFHRHRWMLRRTGAP